MGRPSRSPNVPSRATILAFIDAHVADRDLTPARISAEFELPRTSLYRLLEPYGGVTVLIFARRLDRIAQMLLTGAVEPTELKMIAQRYGFVSGAHFSRAFAARFGMTARSYIAMARSGDTGWRSAQIERTHFPIGRPMGAQEPQNTTSAGRSTARTRSGGTQP